jgi:hypothetical protein
LKAFSSKAVGALKQSQRGENLLTVIAINDNILKAFSECAQ